MSEIQHKTIYNLDSKESLNDKEFLISEYQIRLQRLQCEFKEIKKRQGNKWEFNEHQQAMYDFVMQAQKKTNFTVKGYNIIIRRGNVDFGFMHIILRHYCPSCPGEIKALDILNIGNVIKNDICLPAEKNRIKFIQNKNNEKYTVVLEPKKDSSDLVFTFFSSRKSSED